MPGGNPRHLDPGTACGARTARQALNDRLGQWRRVHFERNAGLGLRSQPVNPVRATPPLVRMHPLLGRDFLRRGELAGRS